MQPTTRPPQTVLLVHNGNGYETHLKHLSASGLHVSESHGESAVADAFRLQPDIIVLDFGCDGEVTAALKANPATAQIPVIALVGLQREERH